jgi:pyridinium-3,5-biscarboxylic acid mononucleotide sulfurtransferase
MGSVAPAKPLLSADEAAALCAASAAKYEQLKATVAGVGSALVAYSGGVDSAFMLKVAIDVLGARCVALTAVSASLDDDEADDAKALAVQLGARHVIVSSNELNDPRYAANPTNRCYFCKSELYTHTERQRVELGLAVVFDGFNADDTKDHRPGHQAARERNVRSPLAEVGMTKKEIRAWSLQLGLPTWEKPQLACLASRLPYGTQVTVQRLKQVGAAEKVLKALGFQVFRVRYHDDVARVEVAADEWSRLLEPSVRAELDAGIKATGFRFVSLDLEPFRSGRLNDALPTSGRALPVVS